MSISTAVSSAYTGIRYHRQQFQQAADRIAQGSLEGRFVEDAAILKSAQHGISANVAVLKTANQMTGTMLDILA